MDYLPSIKFVTCSCCKSTQVASSPGSSHLLNVTLRRWEEPGDEANTEERETQCSPQPKMKAYWEGIIFWVGLVSTSKLLTPPQLHIKPNQH